MNRRSFISTITALAGVVLAKIKAPAADPLHAVTHPYWRRGVATLAPQEPITGLVEATKNFYVFTENGRFAYTYVPDSGWQWIKGDKAFISPADVKRVTPEDFLGSVSVGS